MLSRGDLISLIEQNDLYPSERRSQPMSYVVDKMRKATTVGALAGDIGQSGGGKASVIAVNMSFDYPDPSKAQAVMQSYVTQFLRMDSDQVEDQANLTVRYLGEQAMKLRTQIQALEGQITGSKGQQRRCPGRRRRPDVRRHWKLHCSDHEPGKSEPSAARAEPRRRIRSAARGG